MPVMTVGTGRALIPTGIKYNDKVLATGPIAYWPLWETAGAVAECLVNPAQNGTYSSDVSTWLPGPGIGDGNTAPYFSGNDVVNIYSAAFNAVFNGQLGSVMIWCKVSAPGVWVDGLTRTTMILLADATNYVKLAKDAAANSFGFIYDAAGTLDYTNNAMSPADWFLLGMTWSKAADSVVYYVDGAPVDTDIGLGLWAGGALSNIQTCIGASNTAPGQPWIGWLARAAAWSRVVQPAEWTVLATV